MGARILLVEDDETLAQQIVERLRRADLEVLWIRDGSSALQVDPSGFALLLLDLMLPGAHGLEVLEHWRARSDLPVLILSGKSELDIKVRALDIGADDYLTKPFWPDEMLARVRARLRRIVISRADRIELGPLRIDLALHRALLAGRDVALTHVEFALLCALARRPNAAITRKWLVENILDPRRQGGERTLDVHMSRLRRKLGEYADLLATVWGVGYRLQVEELA